MPNTIRNIKIVDETSFPYVFEKNVDVPLKAGGVVRANVFRPKGTSRNPVLVTYGPYGKDVFYGEYHRNGGLALIV
jgi:predicted acyl esterase